MFPQSVELLSNKKKRWIVSSWDSILAPFPLPVVWTCWWRPPVATMLMRKWTAAAMLLRLVSCENVVNLPPSIFSSIYLVIHPSKLLPVDRHTNRCDSTVSWLCCLSTYLYYNIFGSLTFSFVFLVWSIFTAAAFMLIHCECSVVSTKYCLYSNTSMHFTFVFLLNLKEKDLNTILLWLIEFFLRQCNLLYKCIMGLLTHRVWQLRTVHLRYCICLCWCIIQRAQF